MRDRLFLFFEKGQNGRTRPEGVRRSASGGAFSRRIGRICCWDIALPVT
jgi:hypothetical protein